MKRSLILAAMLAMTLSHTAYAYETEVINNIGIGDISIGLEEYELDAQGNEIPYVDNKVIIPGQKVDAIVRITNNANDAWIRAKLDFASEDGLEGLNDNLLNIASDTWKKIGDYYYYTVPVESKNYVDLIDSIRMPYHWTEADTKKGFKLIVTADAVQEANFDPNFESEDPWFGTIIETCVHTAYDKTELIPQDFSVEFKGGAEGLVKIGDDFFSNWGELMPGDTVSDKVLIKNNYSKSIYMYFSTETIADDDLLKAVTLTINNGDKVIYEGTMDGAIKDKIQLALLRRGEEITLDYTVHVPAELTNKFALNETKTKWIFECKVKSSGGGSEKNPGGPGYPTPTDSITDQTESPDKPDDNDPDWKVLPATGDNALIAGAAGILAVALGGLFVTRRKKEDEEEE